MTKFAQSSLSSSRRIHRIARYDWGGQDYLYREIFERKKIEEELLPNYRPGRYPIIQHCEAIDCSGKPGTADWTKEARNRDWYAESKLGYGTQSVAWLAQEQNTRQYAAIKILIDSPMPVGSSSDPILESEEASIMVRLRTREAGHPGQAHIVHMRDDFYSEQSVHVPSRAPPVKDKYHDKWSWDNSSLSLFHCLVMDPMAETLGDWQRRNGTGEIPLKVIKKVVLHMLQALEYLHAHAVAHNGEQDITSFVPFQVYQRGLVNSGHSAKLISDG